MGGGHFMLYLIFIGAVVGIGGTIAMDAWAFVLKHVFQQPLPNWGFVGRWFYHLTKGKFIHPAISKSPSYQHELRLGWIMHYAIGAFYGMIVTLIGGAAWISKPALGIPLVVGLVTVGAGWFILQPGLGLGIAASKTPNPNKVRGLNILGHIVFALGIYATALIIR